MGKGILDGKVEFEIISVRILSSGLKKSSPQLFLGDSAISTSYPRQHKIWRRL